MGRRAPGVFCPRQRGGSGSLASTFPSEVHEAAAVITFLSPGMHFFHQGQFEGRRKRISPHLARSPEEPIDLRLAEFYDRLLFVLRDPVVGDGEWQLLECRQAWEGNWTSGCFVAYAWIGSDGGKCLVAVNYSDHQSQCYVPIPWPDLEGKMWLLCDRMGAGPIERNGTDLALRGLYLDISAWAYHVFNIHPIGA